MSTRRKRIPETARKVFEGKIFDVYQWDQEMFDGTTSVFERLKRPDTAQVVAVVDGKILIQVEEQPDGTRPFPSIPGGRVDPGEEPLEAAKRELLEETGYAAEDWELWREMDPVGKMEWTVYTFIARGAKKVAEPHLDAGERIAPPQFLSLDAFLALADDESFYSPELVSEMLRMQLDPARKEAFRVLLGI